MKRKQIIYQKIKSIFWPPIFFLRFPLRLYINSIIFWHCPVAELMNPLQNVHTIKRGAHTVFKSGRGMSWSGPKRIRIRIPCSNLKNWTRLHEVHWSSWYQCTNLNPKIPHFYLERYANRFWGDVVLDSFNNVSRDEPNIYKANVFGLLLWRFKVFRVIEENEYLKKYSSLQERVYKIGF